MVNESLTTELERYKERVTIFKQRLGVDLNKLEKIIDSQMDDLIQNKKAKLAAFQQEIDTLKVTLSNNVKEKESLSKTLTVFKTESKEKDSKYIDKEIVLEKQNKELENISYNMYRSTQAMHMLTKPQWIQPTLYDGSVIAKEHAMIYVIDDEETLILEEESRSKMLDKQNYPISIEKKIKISPIDYSKLNKIKEDFGKRFVTKKELSAEQAFWLKHLSFSETPGTSHTLVRVEAPSELPKVSLVNESLKKLKYQLDNFDNVVKKRTTSDAITADEITEVQTVFNQIEVIVDQCSVNKNDFEIQITQLSIDDDQLLKQIMSRDIVHIAVNYSQEKDTIIIKLKDRIKSLIGKDSLENVKKDIDEIETINIELEHSVAKLLSENENLRKEREHLKLIYQDQFDSIRKTRVQSKEHCDSLIAQINAKSVENLDLNAQLQEKVLAITALKNELRKLKGKNDVDTTISKPNATIASGMFKLDIEPISHRLQNNKDAHEVYIKKTIENRETLRRFVERARIQNLSKPLLESACMFTKHVQELLVYVSQTCPNSPKPSEKLVIVTPMNKDKRVRFAKPVVQIVLWYLDSGCSKHMTGNRSQLINFVSKFLGTVRFGNNHIAKIMGYGYYQMHQKDHLYSACALGKSKKHSHKPKAEDFIQEKLYLLLMDLCGPIRVQSINRRKYILVIVDDFSQFTWVKFLRANDEVPKFVIKFLKMIQVRLNATVRNIRTDNGTEFVNQTLRDYYEENRTLVEAARTMLIFSKASLFLWAEAIVTACYTQNRSLIIKRHNKTPYELIHDRKPDLSYLHLFGALCYPTNYGEDLSKLKPKADIGIFVGYALVKKAFRIYNKRTRMIIETIHVNFDVLIAMAFEKFILGPEPKLLTPGTTSSGFMPNF
ncbi:retrovirus-related pol polyprotein from transposon TNT 1-94 [Tanacetum coccineum]